MRPPGFSSPFRCRRRRRISADLSGEEPNAKGIESIERSALAVLVGRDVKRSQLGTYTRSIVRAKRRIDLTAQPGKRKAATVLHLTSVNPAKIWQRTNAIGSIIVDY